MAEVEGSWAIHTVDGAAVRLRSGQVGLMSVDVNAPVTGGNLTIGGDGVHLTLRLALDQLRTGNFLMQAAARSLVTRHDAHVMTYDGAGSSEVATWRVSGHAVSGDIDLALDLSVTASGPSASPMGAIELVGSARVGTVHLPLPGLGTVEDFSFDVDARLALRPRRG